MSSFGKWSSVQALFGSVHKYYSSHQVNQVLNQSIYYCYCCFIPSDPACLSCFFEFTLFFLFFFLFFFPSSSREAHFSWFKLFRRHYPTTTWIYIKGNPLRKSGLCLRMLFNPWIHILFSFDRLYPSLSFVCCLFLFSLLLYTCFFTNFFFTSWTGRYNAATS